MKDILELNVLAELESAAPRVSIPSHEAFKTIIKKSFDLA